MLEDHELASPSSEYRPVPIWFWNGDLDAEELRRQVRAMAAGGLGGLQIAARTGLTTPYMSERWFSLVEAVTQEAGRQGLQVWLADEYPYPSGVNGGELILRHPEYRAWQMQAQLTSVQPGQSVECLAPGVILLAATAVPVRAGRADWDQAIDLGNQVGVIQPEMVFLEPAFGYSKKRTFAFGPRPKLSWTAPLGPESWDVWLVAASEVAPFKFFGYYVDLCNPAAVRGFLDGTYQRYLDRLEPAITRQITGFFLDEAHPPTWSWQFPAAFRRRNGYELAPVLPALWTDVGPRTAQVRYDYWQTVTELFVESFHRPVAEWCRRHKLQLSLEVDSLRNLVQRYADVGGNDPGHEKVGVPLEETGTLSPRRYRGNPRFAASLAAQVGQRRVLDESFHSVGWSLTLQDMKAMVDRLAAQGANFFVFHAFFYTLDGLRKWDAPPSQFLQNPYWPHFPRFTDYVGRLCYALSRGRRVAPIALVDPVTSLWTHGAVGTGAPDPGPDAVAERITNDWQYLFRELEATQHQFDTLDPLLLVEGTVDQGMLRLGEATYRVIVLPPLASLEQAAWEKLEEFAASGGQIIACGLLPYETIEPDSEVIVRCAARFGADPPSLRAAYERPTEASTDAPNPGVEVLRNGPYTLLQTGGTLVQTGAAPTLCALLDSLVSPDLVLRTDVPSARRSFLVAQRQQRDEMLYFIANASGAELDCAVVLQPTSTGSGQNGTVLVESIDLETGTRHGLGSTLKVEADGVVRPAISLRFARYGSHLLVARPNDGEPTTELSAPRERTEALTVNIPLDDAWRCSLDADNALRLDRFRFYLVPGLALGDEPPEWSEDWPLVEPKPLINLLPDLDPEGRRWPVPLRVETPFGTPAQVELRLPFTVWYTAEFAVKTRPERIVLCAEKSAMLGEWAIWLNGEPVPAEAFQSRFRWDPSNREADVRPLLRPGRNRLSVRVTVRQPTDGLVDALYLLGDFGVSFAASSLPVLGPVPREVRWRHLHDDGLPYYAGVLQLSNQIDLPATGQPIALSLPDDVLMYLGVAELTLNGHDLGTRPWAPYRWQVPTDLVQPKDNELTVRLTTTLVGLLEGKRYDPERRAAVRVETEAETS